MMDADYVSEKSAETPPEEVYYIHELLLRPEKVSSDVSLANLTAGQQPQGKHQHTASCCPRPAEY